MIENSDSDFERLLTGVRLDDDSDRRFDDAAGELDAVFEALRHPVRRSVLRSLDRRPGSVHLSALAGRIADGERDADRVEIALHHNHLPRLADLGVVEYDPATRVVAARAVSRLESSLDATASARRR